MSGLECLSDEDVRSFVLGERSEEYMVSHLAFLERLVGEGKFRGDPTIEGVADSVVKQKPSVGFAGELVRVGGGLERLRGLEDGRALYDDTGLIDEGEPFRIVAYPSTDRIVFYSGEVVNSMFPMPLIAGLGEL